MGEERRAGIHGEMSKLYDVFVDWPGRLAREIPGIVQRLREVGATRVLDVGCGTGRHVQALLEQGFDAHGADVSDEMLANAEALLKGRARLHAWRLGDALPISLRELAPFDAITCMGNVWTLLAAREDALAASSAFRELLRPGGLVLLGLKAFGVRRETKNPYLPLLKRVHEGRALWFVRFVDFDVPQPADGTPVCDLHMSVVRGEADDTKEALHHGATRVRAWTSRELEESFRAAGFSDVRVHARLEDRASEPGGEDVFVSAVVGAESTK